MTGYDTYDIYCTLYWLFITARFYSFLTGLLVYLQKFRLGLQCLPDFLLFLARIPVTSLIYPVRTLSIPSSDIFSFFGFYRNICSFRDIIYLCISSFFFIVFVTKFPFLHQFPHTSIFHFVARVLYFPAFLVHIFWAGGSHFYHCF